jgi:hypothetical protein
MPSQVVLLSTFVLTVLKLIGAIWFWLTTDLWTCLRRT